MVNYNKADLILDVNSALKGIFYPLRLKYYKVVYVAKTRILDRNKGNFVFQDSCIYSDSQNSKKGGYLRTELVNDPKIMAGILRRATKYCLDRIIAKL